ncbi:MAG: hypothetical protein RL722_734 [Pseudomonadota bacterium]|jgi:methyl-accepting chemotaxis protein
MTSRSASLIPSAPSTARPAGETRGFFVHHGFWAPGVRLFRQLHFGAKALLICLVLAVPTVGLMSYEVWQSQQRAVAARKQTLQEHVQTALGVIAWAQGEEAAGRMDRAQAQATARQAVARMRYAGKEYFWINDMGPTMVMHPVKPELDGRPLGGMKDPDGLALFQAFVDVVKQDGRGFVAYRWPRPGEVIALPKLSYVEGFAPWGWVVGTGVYVDDLQQLWKGEALRLAGLLVAVALLAAYVFLSFYRVMDGGLRETRRHLRAMTAGDLTTRPTPWGRDEAAQLMLELADMQAALRTMVSRVRTASDQLVGSSGEIASGSIDLSQRTERTATQLEQSASSVRELTGELRQALGDTQSAAAQARRSAEAAAAGGRQMAEVVQTMGAIHASSTRIAEITSTIDAIAFQTNILALNAAVEAARAGEQGRGFAVVASEVRTLAQRSATAAREIKTLIQGSVSQVEAGTEVVRRAGEQIEAMVSMSGQVDQLLAGVAEGARRQAEAMAQIGASVQELDDWTQQNAALVEESAAAAGSLREQAGILAGEVASFRLPEAH